MYLGILNTAAAHAAGVEGIDVKVAVIDTGSDSLGYVSDFYDLTNRVNQHPGRRAQIDANGHGTAMATLVHEVAPEAEIDVIRITDSDPEYVHVLAAVAVAAFDCKADVVNLSLGFPNFGGRCGVCGTDAISRSVALEKLLSGIIDIDPAARPGFVPPIYVAATGNDARASVHYPAAFDFVVAVGSVDSAQNLSSFSNYGAPHSQYLVAPGGEDTAAVSENVGHGSVTNCFGTSVSTAYVSGMFALLRSDHRYRGLNRSNLIKQALSMCVLPPGATSTQYGSGVVRYR